MTHAPDLDISISFIFHLQTDRSGFRTLHGPSGYSVRTPSSCCQSRRRRSTYRKGGKSFLWKDVTVSEQGRDWKLGCHVDIEILSHLKSCGSRVYCGVYMDTVML